MTNVSLRDRILLAVDSQLSKPGNEALDSFVNLPCVEKWQPENMYGLEITKVFNIGLPFALLAGNKSAESHRKAVGGAVGKGEEPSKSLLSEVHAGALLSNWGAKVKFIPQQAHPTPDIQASWGDGASIDVEVVRGDTRQLHKDVQKGLESFCGALQPGDTGWNFIGFIADASDVIDLTAMFDAGLKLIPGESAEEHNKWCIRAVSLEMRDDVVGGRSVELFAPEWWPTDEPAYVVTSSLIGSNVNPAVMFRSLIPLASYRNPILRKATSGQSHPNNPYLIALDVSELPRAHQRIVEELQKDFKVWTHVSAVLLFDPRFFVGIRNKEYIVSIHLNPNASIALVPELAKISSENCFTVDFSLSESIGTKTEN